MKMTTGLQKDSGSSLLYVILLLGIMFVVSFSVSVLAVRELATTNVSQDSQRAFYAAESGIERSLFELSKNPNAELTNPVVVTLPNGDTAEFKYAKNLAGGPVTTDLVTYDIAENESKSIFLFDPENLPGGSSAPTGTQVSFRCVPASACAAAPAPALEVSIISFDQTQVGSFDVAKLQLTEGANTFVDESGIRIEKNFYSDMSNGTSTTPIGVTSGSRLYVLELKAVRRGATYEATFSQSFIPKNVVTIQSYGTADDARRALQVSLQKTREPLSIFNYSLLSNDPIEKFAK